MSLVRSRQLSFGALSVVLVFGALLSRPAAAWGQGGAAGAGDHRASDGLFIPGRTVAGEADATAVEVNPAQLGMLTGPGLIGVVDLAAETAPLPGRGAGLLLGVPLLSSSGFGVGLQGVAQTTMRDGTVSQARTKLQLAYARRLGRTLSVGLSWAHIFGGAYDGLDTFDAGVTWRPVSRAALGLVVRDLGQPSTLGERSMPRLWTTELLLRPVKSDRLELAAAVTHAEGERWRRVAPRLRVLGRLTDGLRLFAEVESLPRQTDYAFARRADYRGSVGLWFDLEHLGAAVAMRTARPAEGAAAFGGAALLRISGDRYPALIEPQQIDRISLEGVGGEREYLTLVRRLRDAGRDRGTAAVLLKIEGVQLGWGRVEEVRDLIAGLRDNGKRVFAYAMSPSTREYYLASACEAVILHPAGIVSLTGLAQSVTFYKGLMDRLGVNVDLVRIAEFKGAMEPFILTEQSPSVRQNRNELLDDVFHRLTAGIAAARGGAARGFTPEKVREIIDGAVYTPDEATKLGLIDAVKDEKEIEDHLRAVMGRRELDIRDPDGSAQRPRFWGARRVGVLVVEGAIIDGPSQQSPFDTGTLSGSDTLVAALEEFRQDPTVGAVVMRINSPGGSAFASDVIARAVRALRKARKPVVVSFSDIAASGGYYIAALADAIFAEPSTTTGSIGIFGYKVDVKRLMGELGLSAETYRRGRHADYASPYRPWTEDEIKLASEKIRHYYGLFLDTIVEGRGARGITRARADELGRGRVWTGAQALAVGLVDRMGGLGAAIDHAARLGRVAVVRGDLPELTVLPRPQLNPLQRLARLGASAQDPGTSAALLGRMLRQLGPGPLRLLMPLLAGDGQGIEARMPFDIDLR